MCEQNPDGVLEGGQFLEDRRRLDQLPVRLRLLDLDNKDRSKFGIVVGSKTVPSSNPNFKVLSKGAIMLD